MLNTKFGKDRFNSSSEDINGQAIAMGHPSYSGYLKTEVNGFRVLCLHRIVTQEVHEETVHTLIKCAMLHMKYNSNKCMYKQCNVF